MKFSAVRFALLAFLSFGASAETLETRNHIVVIESLCGEGHVTCDAVSYFGTSKTSGKSLTLLGSTVHTTCRNGDPCRFLGYEFQNGSYTYFVSTGGRLRVVRNRDEVLIDELGLWAK